MFLTIVVLVAVNYIGVSLAGPVELDHVVEDTELVFAFMIHRHGDRTPIDIDYINSYSTNPEALKIASDNYGYGQLTVQGKQRAYRLGQFIRNRYNSFISPRFNDSEIYLESTAFTRTRMTALIAMAAVFPPIPAESWSDVVNWEPVPYHSKDENHDPNLAGTNCPTLIKSQSIKMQSQPTVMKRYSKLLEKLSLLLNLKNKLPNSPLLVFYLYDVLISQINLGIPLTPGMESLLPEVAQAAGKAIDFVYNDNSTIDLMAGPLLKEFFDYSYAILKGAKTPRLRIYSSHDVNVYAFESILKLIPKQGVPKYTSLLSLELRKDGYGNFFVLPVYVPSPEEEPLYLQVQGCDGVKCSLDQFTEILSPYTLDLSTWRTKCNWVEKL